MITLLDGTHPGLIVLYVVLALILGAIIGFFVARKFLMKELEKKPPINENMIRAMYMQMGRKPSEAQIRQVMNSMKQKK